MNRKPFLKSLSEGRGNCPLPSRTHPQKQTLVVYTEELTHLSSSKKPTGHLLGACSGQHPVGYRFSLLTLLFSGVCREIKHPKRSAVRLFL